jgi:hypothetical protein
MKERADMDLATFRQQCPMLAKASASMFYDGGGSFAVLDDHWRFVASDSLPHITDVQMVQAEEELKAVPEADRETLLCGEHYEQLRLNQSPVLHWVLNVLFDGPPHRFDGATPIQLSYDEWLVGFHEDVERAKTAE